MCVFVWNHLRVQAVLLTWVASGWTMLSISLLLRTTFARKLFRFPMIKPAVGGQLSARIAGSPVSVLPAAPPGSTIPASTAATQQIAPAGTTLNAPPLLSNKPKKTGVVNKVSR